MDIELQFDSEREYSGVPHGMAYLQLDGDCVKIRYEWVRACWILAISIFRPKIECFGLNSKKFGLTENAPRLNNLGPWPG